MRYRSVQIQRVALLMLVCVGGIVRPSAAQVAPVTNTYLAVTSDLGDTLGNGGQFYYDPASAVFSLSSFTSGRNVSVSVRPVGGSSSWSFIFTTPSSPMAPGTYHVPRAFGGSAPPGEASMSADSPSGFCNAPTGTFRLHRIDRPSGVPVLLSIDFEIRCSTETALLRGQLRVNADLLVKTVGNLSTSHLSPIAPGTPVSFRVDSVAGSVPLEYRFIKNNPDGTFQVMREYSFANGFTWVPTAQEAGSYTIAAWVRDRGSAAAHEEIRQSGVVQVALAPAAIVSLTADVALPAPSGSRLTWTALARGGSERLQFKFWRYSYVTGAWQMVRDWSTDNTSVWQSTPADQGRHVIQAWARSGTSGTIESWLSSDPFELLAPTGSWLFLTSEPGDYIGAGMRTFVSDSTSTLTTSASATHIRADFFAVTNGYNVDLAPEIGRVLQPGLFENAERYSFQQSHTPGLNVSGAGRGCNRLRGNFRILELQYTASGTLQKLAADIEQHCEYATPALFAAVRINSALPLFNFLSLTANTPPVVGVGTPVEWRAVASSGTGRVEYKFWLYTASSGSWSVLQNWSQDASAGLSPSAAQPGQYFVQVWARTVGSGVQYQDWRPSGWLTIAPGAPRIYSIETTASPRAGSSVQLRAIGGGGSGNLEFKFWALRRSTGVWTMLRDYAADSTFEWAVPVNGGGDYLVQVWAREAGATGDPAAWAGLDLSILAPRLMVLTGASGEPRLNGSTVTLTPPGATFDFFAGFSSFDLAVDTSGVDWDLEFSPWSGPIVPGKYSGATSSYTTGSPRLNIVRTGVSSCTATGAVTVHEYTPTSNGGIDGLAMDFEQTCSGAPATLYGGIRWNSFVDTLALTAVTATPQPAAPGSAVTLGAIGSSSTEPVEFKFYVRNDATGTWTMVRDYTAAHTVSWTPPGAGSYLVQVWMRRQGQTVEYERFKNSATITVQ